jgi:hypothetical protein
MLADLAWRTGVGVAIGWAALPLLVKVAKNARLASPSAYYRALVAALGIATALVFAPCVRGWTGLGADVPLIIPDVKWARPSSITFVADWVTPLIGSRTEPETTIPASLAVMKRCPPLSPNCGST